MLRSTRFLCLFVMLAMAMQVKSHLRPSPLGGSSSLTRRSHHAQYHQAKRDLSPAPAELVRLKAAVDPGWLNNPWYYDPLLKKKIAASYVFYEGIQLAECQGNSRISNNVFSAFVPYSIGEKSFDSEAGLYGRCVGFTAGPPAEALLEAPNENFGLFWWLGGDKLRPALIPDRLPGVSRTPFPITCPSNLGGCYSKGYYEDGGKVAAWASRKPDSCGVFFPPKNEGHKAAWCMGVGLGCPTPTWQELASGNISCDVAKCKPFNLKQPAYQYKSCSFTPGMGGCPKAPPTKWSNMAVDKSACSCGENPVEKDRGEAESHDCRTCLKDWMHGPDAHCYSEAIVKGLPGNAAPANIASYMLASEANKERILARFPLAKPCAQAGTMETATDSPYTPGSVGNSAGAGTNFLGPSIYGQAKHTNTMSHAGNHGELNESKVPNFGGQEGGFNGNTNANGNIGTHADFHTDSDTDADTNGKVQSTGGSNNGNKSAESEQEEEEKEKKEKEQLEKQQKSQQTDKKEQSDDDDEKAEKAKKSDEEEEAEKAKKSE